VALEVGIVGPPGSGKTSLFTALTKATAGEYGKTNVGIAPIADDRLEALAKVVHARKVTPATIRVQDVPGGAAAQLGSLRQVDALLVVLRGFGADPDPEGDLETFKLELLVDDRDHVARRLERHPRAFREPKPATLIPPGTRAATQRRLPAAALASILQLTRRVDGPPRAWRLGRSRLRAWFATDAAERSASRNQRACRLLD